MAIYTPDDRLGKQLCEALGLKEVTSIVIDFASIQPKLTVQMNVPLSVFDVLGEYAKQRRLKGDA